MPFDFHSRYALLTYAQCGALDPWAVSNRLTELEAECIVAREAHQDGGAHLHVFVDFGRKRRFRDARKFDVLGCHPNVSSSRGTPGDGYDYVCKEGDIVAGGLERPSTRGHTVDKHDSQWSALMDIDNRDDFFEALRTHFPKVLITNFTQVCKYADWRYEVKLVEYQSPASQADFTGIEPIKQWSEEFVTNNLDAHPGQASASKHAPLLGVLSRTHGGPSGA